MRRKDRLDVIRGSLNPNWNESCLAAAARRSRGTSGITLNFTVQVRKCPKSITQQYLNGVGVKAEKRQECGIEQETGCKLETS